MPEITVEFFSALIAVFSLLGVIASNFYIQKARIDEVKLKNAADRKQDKLDYYRTTLNTIIEEWSRFEATGIVGTHVIKIVSYLYSFDDKELSEKADQIHFVIHTHHADVSLDMGKILPDAIKKIGKLIEYEMNSSE